MKVVNYNYKDITHLSFMTEDGNIIVKDIKELEYPYFLGIPDRNKKFSDVEIAHIEHTEKLEIPYLTQTGVKKADGYRVFVYIPKNVPELRPKFTMTFEANIPYIRRLAYDNVIEWSPKVTRYADIDIEERKGEIELIGYIDSIDNEYIPFYSINDFLDTLKKRKILEIYAWNGESYDFKRLNNIIKDEYFKHILKLDAMIYYSIFNQRSPRTLNLAGKENGIGTKIPITKPFNSLTKEEMEIYNKQDVNIQKGVLDKLGIRDIIHNYSNTYALHPLEIYSSGTNKGFQVRASATRIFDSIMIRDYKPRVYLLDTAHSEKESEYQGGFVLEPEKGLYSNIAGFDYNSLYPNVIIYSDYDNYVYNILKDIEKNKYNQRKELKKKYEMTGDKYYDTAQATAKISINSLYGIFGNPYFRYHNTDVASHITSYARQMITKMIDFIKQQGYNVIYGDTDSCFVSDISKEEAQELLVKLNKEISPFEVKLDKYFIKMLFYGDSS